MTANVLGHDPARSRRLLVAVMAVVGLLGLTVVVAGGVTLARRHDNYGELFPGRTPQKLTYCGGRHYLRGAPVTRAAAESASGSMVAVGSTPSGATLFRGSSTIPGSCPTEVWVAGDDNAHVVSYVLSGGP